MPNDSQQTPDDLYEALDRQFRFDYDPASDHENHKTTHYSTLEGTWGLHRCASIATLSEWASKGNAQMNDDGLAHDWTGHRVFVNPPYSRGSIGAFVDKMIAERNNAQIIVAVVKADPSTRWWQRLEWYANIEFLPKRVRFVDPGNEGQKAGAKFPTALVVMKKDYPL